MCCLLEVKWGQDSRMLGWREGDVSCGGFEKEMELVVWELW